jgi:hypothetical protein
MNTIAKCQIRQLVSNSAPIFSKMLCLRLDLENLVKPTSTTAVMRRYLNCASGKFYQQVAI